MSDPKRAPVFERPLFVAVVAGVGFWILSFVSMGLAPWTTLDIEKPGENPYVDSKGRLTSVGKGRQTYIQEGCWHCHSQFVRPVAGEPSRYGPVSEAWESAHDVPQLYGTRRIGPDLSREAGRRTDDWHLAHLHDARSVVPLSVMPSYPYLFKGTGDEIEPTAAAEDLVAYLQQIGKSFSGEVEKMAYPEPVVVTGAPPETAATRDRGRLLFGEHCSGCHGPEGDGRGSARPFLRPSAADLTVRYVPPEEVFSTLTSGVVGSAMPSFHEMTTRDLWALSWYVTSLGEPVRRLFPVELDAATLALAERIYTRRSPAGPACADCHALDGSAELPEPLRPRARPFTRRLFDPDHVARVLEEGRPGSQMLSYSRLSAEEKRALALYIARFYREAGRGADD